MSPVVGGRGRSSFHLLEVTVVSAQDLHSALPGMRPYAVVWVDPARERLRTRTDPTGRANPTWNDKFVFRVEDDDDNNNMAAVTVLIRASRGRGCGGGLLRDPEVGTARLLLSSLLLSAPAQAQRCLALQVRRPGSLRPQGILNVSVALLDVASLSGLRSLQVLCGDVDDKAPSAIAYRDIIPSSSSSSSSSSKWGRGSGKEEEEKENEKGRGTWEGMVVREQQQKQPGAQLERKKSVEEGKWVGVKEQEALESKLEQWRIDLSPERDTSDWSRSLRRPLSCFSCVAPAGAAK